MLAGGNIDKSTSILLLVPPPELHLLIGPVNTLYKELCIIWTPCKERIKRLLIKREKYHGGSFNGNDCRKLLKNIDILKGIATSPSTEVKGFIDAFMAFDEVVTLRQRPFCELLRKNKPKVHAIFFHVSEFCNLKKMGLSPWKEQTSESAQHDFKNVWQCFNVCNTNHPEYTY